MIEFRCPQCQSLLRTADDKAGRQARCPSCGGIVPIPAASVPAAPAPPPPPSAGSTGGGAAPPTDDPFAEDYSLAPQEPLGGLPPLGDELSSAAADNPYRSPLGWGPDPSPASFKKRFAPRPVDVGFILSAAWGIFRDRLSLCLMAFVVLIGANMVMMFLLQGSMLVAQNLPPAGQVGLTILGQIASNLLSIWLNLGMIRMFLALGRGQNAELSLIFAGGPYLLRALGATILFLLVGGGLFVLTAAPLLAVAIVAGPDSTAGMVAGGLGLLIGGVLGAYLMLGLMMYQYCLVDQNAGMMDALRMSWQLAAGNRLTLILLMLVMMLLGIGGILCCCVGIVFTAPYGWLALAVAYLLMSGQGVIRPQTWN